MESLARLSSQPTVIVRADASSEIGTGHVMRCLTFAGFLKDCGCQVTFVVQDRPGKLTILIRNQGMSVVEIPPTDDQTADVTATLAAVGTNTPTLVVLDNYLLDEVWENQFLTQHSTARIFVIDDLANRKHTANYLLDQNLIEAMEYRYSGLVLPKTRLFIGPQYALIRSEFYKLRQELKKPNTSIKKILVSFGGSDPTNETEKALDGINKLNLPLAVKVDVVLGPSNPHAEKIRSRFATRPQFKFYKQVENMAALMADADVAIGATGSTSWERCLLGLPAIVVSVAPNQEPIAEGLAEAGVALWIGRSQEVSSQHYYEALRSLADSKTLLKNMHKQGQELMANNVLPHPVITTLQKDGIFG